MQSRSEPLNKASSMHSLAYQQAIVSGEQHAGQMQGRAHLFQHSKGQCKTQASLKSNVQSLADKQQNEQGSTKGTANARHGIPLPAR